VQQQLGRVKAVALFGRVRSVNAVAVALPGARFRQVDVPDLRGLFRHANAGDFFVAVRPVEQAQLDAGGVLREEREIDPGPIPGGAERVRLSRPYSHTTLLRRPWMPAGACPEGSRRAGMTEKHPPAVSFPRKRESSFC